MNSVDSATCGNACMLDASSQEGRERIEFTLRRLDEMNETFQDNFTHFRKEIFDICRELDVAAREFSSLESQICSQLNLSTNSTSQKQPFPTNSSFMDALSLSSGHLTSSGNLKQQNCYEDELSSSDLLIKIEEKMHRLRKTTSESLASVLKKLRVVKEDSNRNTHALNELRKKVEKAIEDCKDLNKIDLKSSNGK